MPDEPLEVELTILPDSSAPERPPSRRMLHRRARPPVLGALAVVAGLIAGGLVLIRDDDVDPNAVLQDAQTAAADVRSFEFRLTAEDSQSVGGGHIGTDVIERFVANGKWSEDRWWVKSTTNSRVAEVLIDGDVAYSREVDLVGGSIRDVPWITADAESPGADNLVVSLTETGTWDELRFAPGSETPVVTQDGGPDEERVRAATDVYLGVRAGGPRSRHLSLSDQGFDRSPRGFLEVIENMTPTAVADGPGDTLRLTGRLTASEDFEVAFGAPIPSARVVLHLDANRVPTRLRFETRDGRSVFSVDVAFSDWSDPVAIAVPTADEVDETPTVDEEHLVVAAQSIELVWPTAIPAGWELSYLAALPADGQAGGLGPQISRLCDVIQINWTEPTTERSPGDVEVAETAGFRLVLTPLSCALAVDSTPFSPAIGTGGLPIRQTSNGDFEAQVGNTAVTVQSWLLDQGEFDQVMASFSRVDVDTLIAAAAATGG